MMVGEIVPSTSRNIEPLLLLSAGNALHQRKVCKISNRPFLAKGGGPWLKCTTPKAQGQGLAPNKLRSIFSPHTSRGLGCCTGTTPISKNQEMALSEIVCAVDPLINILVLVECIEEDHCAAGRDAKPSLTSSHSQGFEWTKWLATGCPCLNLDGKRSSSSGCPFARMLRSSAIHRLSVQHIGFLGLQIRQEHADPRFPLFLP